MEKLNILPRAFGSNFNKCLMDLSNIKSEREGTILKLTLSTYYIKNNVFWGIYLVGNDIIKWTFLNKIY